MALKEPERFVAKPQREGGGKLYGCHSVIKNDLQIGLIVNV